MWERVDDCFGYTALVENSLSNKLELFPVLISKYNENLFELTDIVSEIESVNADPKYTTLLAHFDSSHGGIHPPLSYNLREKWVSHSCIYNKNSNVSPFHHSLNDPSIGYDNISPVTCTNPDNTTFRKRHDMLIENKYRSSG